jgi:DNA-binding NtrC family response regulator
MMEVAEGGTLFIDEFAETALGLQAKPLRALEDGHFRRVGGTQERCANVRVLVATSRGLEEEMRAGRFREELYFRLNVVTIWLPPLRERPEDIPELVEHFLATRPLASVPTAVTPEALTALVYHDWPGNVRELANVLERAQILADDRRITSAELPEEVAESAPPPSASGCDPRRLSEVERRHVLRVLRQENGNKVHAARALGISRRALYRLIAKHRLENRSGRQAASG